MSRALEGKRIAVTGAGRGLGAEIARLAVDRGARVMLIDVVEDGVRALAEELGDAARFASCDVSDESSVSRVCAEMVEQLGGVDGLVNNAGIVRLQRLEEVTLENWNLVLSVNLTGAFLATKHFGAVMLEQGSGSIVNISSLASHQPTPTGGAYSASKAGSNVLARQVAVEWGPRGIRGNAINPGFMRTEFSARFFTDPVVLAAREALVASRRIGEASEIAQVAAFLLSDHASYVNGASVDVDGGYGQMLSALAPRPLND